jgi:hypothetical protein
MGLILACAVGLTRGRHTSTLFIRRVAAARAGSLIFAASIRDTLVLGEVALLVGE